MKRLKEVIIIFTVAIIISLGSMITFSVLSEDSPIVNIKYNNETWNGQGEFNEKFKWFTNENEIKFTVDLKEKYQEYVNSLQDGETPVSSKDEPFEVTANIEGDAETYDVNDVNVKEIQGTNGIYEVTIKLPVDSNNKPAYGENAVNIKVKMPENNPWNTGIFEKDFMVQIDVTAPVVNITNINNGQIYESDNEVIFELIEKNYSTTDVKVEVLRDDVLEEFEELKNLNTKFNDVHGTYSWEPVKNGIYKINITAIDKAGNKSENLIDSSVDISKNFEIRKANAISEVLVNGEVLLGEKKYNSDITIKVNPLRENATKIFYVINGEDKDSNNGENRHYLVDAYNNPVFEYTFINDGSYKLYTEEQNIRNENITLEIGSIIIDKSKPTLTVEGLDSEGLFGQDSNGINIYTIEKDIQFKLEDNDINFDSIVVEATRNGEVYTGINFNEINGQAVANHRFKSGKYNIKISAKDNSGNLIDGTIGSNEFIEYKFIVDTDKPTIKIEGVTEGKKYYEDKIVKVTVEDTTLQSISAPGVNCQWTYSNDNTKAVAEIPYNNDGLYNLKITASDIVNGDPVDKEVNFTIDKNEPIINITGIADNSINKEDKEVSIDITDLTLKSKKIKVLRNGKDYDVSWKEEVIPNGFNYKYTFDEGSYVITVDAKDEENRGEPKVISFKIDKESPSITIEGINENEIYKSKSVLITVRDTTLDEMIKSGKLLLTNNNVIDNINWTISEGGTVATYKYDANIDGAYVLKVSATDSANNAPTEISKSFVIDNKAPEITISGVENGEAVEPGDSTSKVTVLVDELNYQSNTVNIDVKVEKNGVVEDYVGFPEWKNKSVSHTFTQDGIYTINVTSKDAAGNEAEPQTLTFTVDSKKPVITFSGIEDGACLNGDKYTLTINVDDISISEDGIKIITATKDGLNYNFKNTWVRKGKGKFELKEEFTEEGKYYIAIEAIDGTNKSKKNEISFVIDRTAAKISVEGLEENDNEKDKDGYTHFKEDKYIKITVEDENIKKDGSGFKEPEFKLYKFEDGVEKLVTLQELGSKWSFENEKIHTSFNLEEGRYTIEVNYTDESGNISEALIKKFVIDKTAPKISIINNDIEGTNKNIKDNGDIFGFKSNVSIIIKDLNIDFDDKDKLDTTKFNIKINNKDVTKDAYYDSERKSIVLDYECDENDYTIVVNAKDIAGNEAAEKKVNFTVDTNAPELTLQGVTEGKYYKDNVKISATIKDTTLNFEDNKTYLKIIRKDKKGKVLKETIYSEENQWTITNGKEAKLDVEIPNTDEGVYEVILESIDKGNRENSISTETVNFVIDNTDPEIEIINTSKNNIEINESGDIFNIDSNIKITIRDLYLLFDEDGKLNKNNSISINGEDVTDEVKISDNKESVTLEKDLTEGNYVITVKAIDSSGRTNKKTCKFTIDTTVPEIEINNVGDEEEMNNAPHYNEDKKLEVIVSDTTLNIDENTVLSVVKTDKDGKNPEEIITEDDLWIIEEVNSNLKKAKLTKIITEEGYYTVTLTSKDNAGHTNTVKRCFIIDKTKPIITISGLSEEGLDEDIYYVKSSVQSSNLTITVDELNSEKNTVDIKLIKDGKEVKLPKELEWDNSKNSVSYYDFEEGQYEVIVTAKDSAGNEAEEKRIKFIVDNTAAKITFEGIEKDTFNNKDNNRELKVNVNELNFKNNKVIIVVEKDGKPFELSNKWINEGENSTNIDIDSFISNTFDIDGYYTIKVNTVDKAGNENEARYTFTIDQENPELKIEGFLNGNKDSNGYTHYKDSQNISIEVLDNNFQEDADGKVVEPTLNIYKIEGNNRKNVTKSLVGENNWVYNKTLETDVKDICKLNFDIDSKTEEGTYELELSYKDKANNSISHEIVKFIIDSTKPEIKLSGISNDSFNNLDKTLSILVDETNFTTNTVIITAKKNGAEYNLGNWANTGEKSVLNYNFTEDGRYEITVASTDYAGNVSESKSIVFTIDKTNPLISIEGVTDGEYYNINKTVSILVDDNNHNINTIDVTKSGVSYNMGNFNISGTSASVSHTFTAEGDYVITVNSTDKAGNKSSKVIKFTIDKTAPVITPKFSGKDRVIKDGEFINEIFTPVFTLDKAEDMIVSVTLNNGENIKDSIPMASKEGKYSFNVVAKDKAGNESKLSVSFTIDVTKPELNLKGIVDSFFNKGVTPKYNIKDINLDSSRTSVTLNGNPFVSGTTIEKEGEYTLKLVATDLANNVTSRTIIFTIDKTNPKIIFEEEISGKYFTETIIPKFLIEDMTEYTIITQTLDGEPYKLGDPIEKDGKHVLFLEIKDKAGNITQQTIEFKIDQTKPKFIVSGVKDKGKYYKTVNISITLDNPFDTIKSILVNDELVEGEIVEEDGQKVVKLTLSENKDYELKLLASDEAGNECEEVITFRIAEKNFLVKASENKVVFGSFSVIAIILVIGYLFSLKKNKNTEEKKEGN